MGKIVSSTENDSTPDYTLAPFRRTSSRSPAFSPAGQGISRGADVHSSQPSNAPLIEETMRRAKLFHVYIMTNRQRSHVLYTGITGNLTRRVWEHKNKIVEGFTSRYKLTRLAYFGC